MLSTTQQHPTAVALRCALHDMTGPLRAQITLDAYEKMGASPFLTAEEVYGYEGTVRFEVKVIVWFQREHFGVFYSLLDEAQRETGINFQPQRQLVRRAAKATDIWRLVDAINHEVIPALNEWIEQTP
jgi:hypothetical protein